MYSLVISYGCTLLIYYHCNYFNDCISFSNLGVQCLIITDLNTKYFILSSLVLRMLLYVGIKMNYP